MMMERQRRILIGCMVLTGVIALLVLRLGWIQTIQANRVVPGFQHTLREMSVLQRERGIMLDSGRGHFTDFQGRPITGNIHWGLVLFPSPNPSGKKAAASANHLAAVKLANILHTAPEQILNEWEQGYAPHFWTAGKNAPAPLNERQILRIRQLKLANAEVYPMMTRYEGLQRSGMQWLGYLAELPDEAGKLQDHRDEVRQPFALKRGAAGLERTLEPLLMGIGPTLLTRMVNGAGEAIPELAPRVIAPHNGHYPLKVETTIDVEMQHKLEQMAEHFGMIEGAVVVLDATNADVRAMVSMPFYNAAHVDPRQSSWANRAVKEAAPGSIFKIVTAAAALETHAVSGKEQFHCKGDWGKYGLSCWKEHGHGTLNLEQGFARSCNIVFAETSERLTMKQLERTADKLGLARTVGWERKHMAGMPLLRHFDHEDAGRVSLPTVVTDDEGARAQTAIGQRDTRVTPLQAANLVVTLLHDGEVRAPRLVQRIRYADGGTMLDMPLQTSPSRYGRISPSTAHRLLTWMGKVVSDGTGKSLQRARWHVAGKSGTAQVVRSGEKLNHQWFIGYGPVEQPRYAVAVLVQHVKPGGRHQATDLFRKVMDYLSESSS